LPFWLLNESTSKQKPLLLKTLNGILEGSENWAWDVIGEGRMGWKWDVVGTSKWSWLTSAVRNLKRYIEEARLLSKLLIKR